MREPGLGNADPASYAPDVNDEQRKILDDLMWKGEMAMRDRGLSDAEIAEKKRQLRELIEQRPPDDAGWERLARLDAGEPPMDVMGSFGKDDWIVRLASHRTLFRLALVAITAFIGYFGAWGRGNDVQIFPTRVPGLLFGVAIGIVVLVLTELSMRAQRRRRSP